MKQQDLIVTCMHPKKKAKKPLNSNSMFQDLLQLNLSWKWDEDSCCNCNKSFTLVVNPPNATHSYNQRAKLKWQSN